MIKNLDLVSPLDNAVLDFIEKLTRDDNVEKLVVFGSRSKSDYERYSDLDLAVKFLKINNMKWLKYKEFLTYDINTTIKISLVDYINNPQKLREAIDNNGVVIYEQQTKSG